MRKVSALMVLDERSPSMNKYFNAMPKLAMIKINTNIITVLVIMAFLKRCSWNITVL